MLMDFGTASASAGAASKPSAGASVSASTPGSVKAMSTGGSTRPFEWAGLR